MFVESNTVARFVIFLFSFQGERGIVYTISFLSSGERGMFYKIIFFFSGGEGDALSLNQIIAKQVMQRSRAIAGNEVP